MKKNNIFEKKFIIIVLTVLIACRTIFVASITYKQVHTKSFDLRNRVVGTRVALQGRDPYFYIEPANGDERLLDPLVTDQHTQTRLSVTPTALLIHVPLAQISFSNDISMWFILEWTLLLLTFITIYMTVKRNFLMLLLAFLLFANSPFWLTHLGSAQMYIIYTFISAFIFRLYKRKEYKVMSFFIGAFVLLRPPYILLSLLLLGGKQNSHRVRYALLGASTILISTSLLFSTHVWTQYARAMMTASSNSPSFFEPEYMENQVRTIEGWVISKEIIKKQPVYEVSIKTMIYEVTGKTIPTSILLIAVIFIYILIIKLLTKANSKESFFAILMATIIISEYFIPAKRYLYSDIQWIVPLLIILR